MMLLGKISESNYYNVPGVIQYIEYFLRALVLSKMSTFPNLLKFFIVFLIYNQLITSHFFKTQSSFINVLLLAIGENVSCSQTEADFLSSNR